MDAWYSCNCAPGYEGLRCETNVDDCLGNKCANNASCVDLVEAYRCDCLPGFTGEHCQTKIPFCAKEHDPCKNGGRCVDHQSHYSCECPSGFAGANCTDNLDDCDNNLCQVSVTLKELSIYKNVNIAYICHVSFYTSSKVLVLFGIL